ncbi:DNA/RNA non-specific endonuclease [Lacticaseibacillus zhaodongensis]|uniref:DNA/RNA non-specific endonuclease n=1 Tax=Lacticaseibacillus zhaodongensis TaxID=2668065 RepID=UPI0012D2DCDA|nr:DNA/RNA non-specific endonuclease [Lacticaseibacillus zhaodongensis]
MPKKRKKRGKRSSRRNSQWAGVIAIILAAVLYLYRGGYLNQWLQPQGSSPQISAQSNSDNALDKNAYAKLAQLDFKSGDKPVVQVNGGKSTLDAASWHSERIAYGDLDHLNRTTVDTAYLSNKNLGKSAGRPSQDWTPTGWHYNHTGKEIYNRGHLIAYTVTFDINADGQYEQGAEGSSDNPKNLATQSAYSNQVLMQIYEEQVREALAQGKHFIYQVTTVFRGSELMPRGYWLQGLATNGSVNFNVYIFNVQPGYDFDYATGSSRVDQNMRVDESGLDK